MMRQGRIVAAVLLSGAVLLGGACSSESDSAGSTTTVADVGSATTLADVGDTTLPAGGTGSSSSTELPELWPGDLETPAGMTVTSSTQGDAAGLGYATVKATMPGDADAIIAELAEKLTAAGFTIKDQGGGADGGNINSAKGDLEISVTLQRAATGTDMDLLFSLTSGS